MKRSNWVAEYTIITALKAAGRGGLVETFKKARRAGDLCTALAVLEHAPYERYSELTAALWQ